jgi:hypothetical protein
LDLMLALAVLNQEKARKGAFSSRLREMISIL